MRPAIDLALVIGAANLHDVNLCLARQICVKRNRLTGLNHPWQSVTRWGLRENIVIGRHTKFLSNTAAS
jgi:hypothetical protein